MSLRHLKINWIFLYQTLSSLTNFNKTPNFLNLFFNWQAKGEWELSVSTLSPSLLYSASPEQAETSWQSAWRRKRRG